MVALFRLSAAFIFLGITSAATIPQKRDQCQGTLNAALNVATNMVNHYFNSGTGGFNGGSLWTDANAMEDLGNLMLATGRDDWAWMQDISTIGKAALSSSTNWASVVAGSNDDSGWIVLALWKIADYKGARGGNYQPYLDASKTVYNLIAQQWDDICGGGVWWSGAHTYKNSITNELFLLISAQGYNKFGDPAYLANAQKTWNWLKNSGLRNSAGLWNDGLDSVTCLNNGQTTWTYNQGVIASGLGALSAATGDKTLLDQAEITLDAVVNLMSTNNILKESCDNANSGGAVCNADQQIFKGLWAKHVQFYLDSANDASRTAKYAGYLWSQSSAVEHYATGSSGDPGSVWYAPNNGGSVFTPKTSSSGLAAHVSAAKYGVCGTY